eukprot:1609457-Amphidinium_carterae.1
MSMGVPIEGVRKQGLVSSWRAQVHSVDFPFPNSSYAVFGSLLIEERGQRAAWPQWRNRAALSLTLAYALSV